MTFSDLIKALQKGSDPELKSLPRGTIKLGSAQKSVGSFGSLEPRSYKELSDSELQDLINAAPASASGTPGST